MIVSVWKPHFLTYLRACNLTDGNSGAAADLSDVIWEERYAIDAGRDIGPASIILDSLAYSLSVGIG